MPDMKDWKWIDLPETGSTNDEARKYSAVAGGGKFVITAVRQNNGRAAAAAVGSAWRAICLCPWGLKFPWLGRGS